MYKTAVITDEISQDVRRAAQMAQQYKLDAIEIRSVSERNPFQMTREDALDIKRVADEFDLKICCAASPLFKIDYADMAAREEHLSALKRTAEFMKIWGTDLIRGFSFMKNSSTQPTLEQVAESYLEPLRIAHGEGFTFVMESEPHVTTTNFKILIDLLEMVNDPALMALYDPANEECDPLSPPAYPDGWAALSPWIRHVHIKDILPKEKEFLPVMIGEGAVDFDGLIPFLKREFPGYCSVETHYRIKEDLSHDSIVHPQGSAFSLGGEEATRAYLERLDKKWRWRESAQ